MRVYVIFIILLLVFALEKSNTINNIRIIKRTDTKFHENIAKEDQREAIRKRLRTKIARLVAIRHGRRAYDRWLINQDKKAEKEQSQKIDTGLFGALAEHLWSIKLCVICWR